MATPSYSYVISQINTFIVANGNNEITANVLNPILEVITDFANNHMGDLDNLTTDETDTLVDAINSLKQNINDIVGNSVQLHVGNANPNDEPPTSYNYGDFYMQLSPLDNDPIQLWQFNGFEWFAPDAATSWGEIEGNIADQTDLQEALDLKADVTDLEDYQLLSEKGEANGYTPLDSGAKVPIEFLPDSVIGQVNYQGTWNASTNTPDVGDATTQKGYYYVTSVAGTYSGIIYEVGDWIISNGVEWQKVDNTDAVVSVFGRIGAVVANSGDYAAFYSPIINGGASTIVTDNLTANRALVSNVSGKVAVSDITSTELGYLDNVTSNIQTQINAKQATITGGAASIVSSNLTASRALVSDGSGKVAVSSVTSTELSYVSGVTSAIQTQIDNKLGNIPYSSNVNLISVSGHYLLSSGSTNIPSGEGATGASLMHYQWDSNAAKQVFYAVSGNNSYWRAKAMGSWAAWQKYWTNTNDGSGSGLDADLLRGVHWGNVNTNIVTSGTVTAAPATLSTELITKGQLDAAARPYKVYTALLSQSGTSAPTAKVLENTLGFVPTFGYSSEGVFSVNSSGGFTNDKTYISFTIRNGSLTNWIGDHAWSSSSVLQITSKSSGVLTNGFPSDAELEIRVYP